MEIESDAVAWENVARRGSEDLEIIVCEMFRTSERRCAD